MDETLAKGAERGRDPRPRRRGEELNITPLDELPDSAGLLVLSAWIADPAGPQGWTSTNSLIATQIGN